MRVKSLYKKTTTVRPVTFIHYESVMLYVFVMHYELSYHEGEIPI